VPGIICEGYNDGLAPIVDGQDGEEQTPSTPIEYALPLLVPFDCIWLIWFLSRRDQRYPGMARD